MKEICESAFGTVIDVCLAAKDFGNHGQTTNQGSRGVSNTNPQHIPIQIGFSFFGVEHVNSLGAD